MPASGRKRTWMGQGLGMFIGAGGHSFQPAADIHPRSRLVFSACRSTRS